MHALSHRPGSRQVRGEIHPGMVAIGLVAALAGAWWLAQGGTSSPAVVRAAAVAEDAPARTSSATNAPDADAEAATGKPLYKWTDAAGVVHFTDVPPSDRPYVEADVRPDRNVVRTPGVPEP